MIILDTHIWVWWVHGIDRLSDRQFSIIRSHEGEVIGVSAISCWEVAKLVAAGRLSFPVDISEWFDLALQYPGVKLLELTPQIAVESTRLPAGFHRDPADQIIAASARVHACPLVISDAKILKYPHVDAIG